MTFRPDSPLNRLLLLWPGVPIGACALGFSLSLIEVGQSHSPGFAALAIAMGMGLALSIGLLFHSFFITWLEVSVTADGLAVRPVGMAWIRVEPRVLPWDRIEGAREVVTRQGGRLTIATTGEQVVLDQTLFRPETYEDLRLAVLSRVDRWQSRGLAAAA
jgi:hypothetical protein